MTLTCICTVLLLTARLLDAHASSGTLLLLLPLLTRLRDQRRCNAF